LVFKIKANLINNKASKEQFITLIKLMQKIFILY